MYVQYFMDDGDENDGKLKRGYHHFTSFTSEQNVVSQEERRTACLVVYLWEMSCHKVEFRNGTGRSDFCLVRSVANVRCSVALFSVWKKKYE